MAITETDLKNLIAKELHRSGDTDFAATITLLWEFYKSKDTGYGFLLRYLYVKWHCLNTIIGDWFEKYNTREDDITENEGDVIKNLLSYYKTLENSISVEEERIGGNYNTFISEIAQTSPIPLNQLSINPNSILFNGYPVDLNWTYYGSLPG